MGVFPGYAAGRRRKATALKPDLVASVVEDLRSDPGAVAAKCKLFRSPLPESLKMLLKFE